MNRSLVALALLLCSCTGFDARKTEMDSAFFTPGETSLTPSTDKVSANCFADPAADACIFLKNPVAQEKAAVALSESDRLRKFGVKIRGLAATGFLENSRVQVYALNAPRFSLANRGSLKSAAGGNAVEQFSAYYWSNRLFDYLEARVGAERLPLRGLKIYADDAFTGYSASNKSVHLEKRDGRWPKALSGEVVIHLTGQALADALSGNKVFRRDNVKHNFCALDPKACCSSIDGCAQALANGFGEYLAAMMFPESARVGESIAGSTDGQKICSVSRDLAALGIRTKAEVHAACQPAGRAVLLGAWYAAVWWKLRTQLEAQEGGASADVDKIFFDHAKAWSSDGTFVEAKAEALRLAAEFKAGKYLAAFNAAFTAAGL